MKQKRLERGNRLHNDQKNHGNRIVIFSDEKTFTVDPVVNKQNDRIVSFGQNIWVTERVNNQTFGLCDDAWSRGIEWRKDAPSVVPTWLQANHCCLKIFSSRKSYLGWKKKLKNSNYVFQQDGAPAHTANIVQEWLGLNPRTSGCHSRLTWTPSNTASGRTLRPRPVKFATAVYRSWSFPLIVHGLLWEKISATKFARISDLV